MFEESIDYARSKTLGEWVTGSALVWAGKQALFQAPRRGIRYGGALTKGLGRHLHASYKTLGDFHRATRMGNQPFAVERHFMPATAMAIVAATPVAMLVAAVEYPTIAGPAQSTAATGQVGIGSRAGQELIFGRSF